MRSHRVIENYKHSQRVPLPYSSTGRRESLGTEASREHIRVLEYGTRVRHLVFEHTKVAYPQKILKNW